MEPQIVSVAALLGTDRWVGEWRMEEWKDGSLYGGSVLGWQVHHDLEVEEVEFGDRRQREVKVRIDGADHGRWTVDDGRLAFARWNVGTFERWAIDEWRIANGG